MLPLLLAEASGTMFPNCPYFVLFVQEVIAWRGVKEIQGGCNDFEREGRDTVGVQGRALEDEGSEGRGGYIIKTTDHSKGGYPCT